MLRYLSAALAVALAASAASAADDAKKTESVFAKTENGTPKIESITAIAFGPNGALLLGDSKGSQLVAIDTKDVKSRPWKATSIEKFNEKVADKLGTTADKVEFGGLAVNRASGTAYVIVKHGGKATVVTVNGDGKIGEVVLEKVDHVAVPLPKGTTQITDVAWTKDRILVGGLSNEKFKAKIFSIPTPLDPANKAKGFSTETYHVAHGRWETSAPMTTLIPYESGGKKYVVGAFACMPLVRYPLVDVKEDGKVKGSSVIELGNGNRPQGMFAYDKGGKSYLLINNHRMQRFHDKSPVGPSPYWVARVDMSVFDETEKVNEKAEWRVEKGTTKPKSDKVKVVDAFSGTRYMNKLNDTHAVVLKDDGKKGVTLAALELP